ncbi:MAG: sigma-70 family RNA polymerase sigma factor [Acidobacteriota bacterium]
MEAQCFFADQQQVETAGRDLIERMARQDQIALQEFYEQYHKLAFSFALRILGCRAEAEEVTLEVFWQVWQQASQYNQSRGSVSAWLIMMTRSRAIDRRRARERRDGTLQALEVDSTNERAGDCNFDPEESIYSLERRTAVLDALAEMGEKQRQVIELAYFNGLSQSEIATLLDEPLGTVKTRIRTALQVLREKLKRYLQQ